MKYNTAQMRKYIVRLRVEPVLILSTLLLTARVHAADGPLPDAGFLEYLGLMVEEDGEYIDLMDLAEVRENSDDPATTLPEASASASAPPTAEAKQGERR